MTVVENTSRLVLHDLSVRRDGAEYVVGRVDTGDFVAVPPVALAALRQLERGLSVRDIQQELRQSHGKDVDIASFACGLVAAGFVRTVDGITVPAPEPVRSTLPAVRPHHVRWLVGRWTVVAVAALIAAALAVVVLDSRLRPDPRDLIWSPHSGIVLLGNLVTAWALILLHELGHLLSARAYGVPGRIGLSTRLQFLTAHTDVSGMWAAPRRARLAVYLSGFAVDLSVLSTGIIAAAVVGPDTPVGRAISALVLITLLLITPELLVFMRTDVYFVLQDLTGARNLYADGSAHVRWWWRRARRRPARGHHPGHRLTGAERRAVRVYALVLAVGTVLCVGTALLVTVPNIARLVAQAVATLAGSTSRWARVDAAAAMVGIAVYWVLWSRAWWKRHGPRIRSAVDRGRQEGGGHRGADRHPETGQDRDDQAVRP
jgi:putative peptide zinc metalloprotease protein